MRITNNTFDSSLVINIQNSEQKMAKLETQISSAKKISEPSDDPVATRSIMQINSSLSRIQQWLNNSNQATGLMNNTDSVMGNVQSMWLQVKQIAVEGANDTESSNDRQALKKQVDQIAQQMVTCANTKVNGQYIFAGSNTSVQPIISSGSPWTGNNGTINYEVGSNQTITVNVNGANLFSNSVIGQDGTTSPGLLQTLSNLSQALGNNDSQAVSSLLKDIDANNDNISLQRADLGSRESRLSALQNQLQSTQTNLQQNLSGLQDTDMAQAITDYTNQSNVYKAALETGAQIMQLSLVDFMK